jgi:hypothetical protein
MLLDTLCALCCSVFPPRQAYAFRTSLFDSVRRFSSRPTKALASSNLLTLRDNLNVLFSASPLAPFERRLFSFLRFIYQLDIAPHRLSGILYHVHTAALASFFASHYIRRAAGIFCLATLRTHISFMQRNLLGGGFFIFLTCGIQRLENSCVYTELRMIDGVIVKDIYTIPGGLCM